MSKPKTTQDTDPVALIETAPQTKNLKLLSM